MAKIKDYEAFPKGLGALRMEHKPTRKQSARGRRETQKDIVFGTVPILIAAGAVAYLVSRQKKKLPPLTSATSNPV